MADILGATSSSGLGSNRKSRTPVPQDRVTNLDTGGNPAFADSSVGFLDPRVIDNIHAPDIRHRRDIIPLTKTADKYHKPLISTEAVYRGTKDILNAVVKYQDEVSTQKARQSLLSFREAAAQSFHDQETGFRHTKQFEATEGFKGYTDKLDSIMKEHLENLSPSARKKAVYAMYSVRESYLDKATTHVSQQKNQINKDLNTTELISLKNEMFREPQNILPAKDGSPSVLKQNFLSKFDDYETANNAWHTAVIEASERIYIDKHDSMQDSGYSEGLSDLKTFRNSIGLGELDGDALNKLDTYIERKENNETKNYLAKEREIEEKRDKVTKIVQEKNEAITYRQLAKDPSKAPTVDQMYDMEILGKIPHGSAKAYEKAHKARTKKDSGKPTDDVEASEAYSELFGLIQEFGPEGGILPDGTSLVSKVSEQASVLGNSRHDSLIKLIPAVRDKKFKDDLARGKERVKAVVTGFRDIYGRKTNDEQFLENNAIEDLTNRLHNGEPYDKAISSVEQIYSNMALTRLPSIEVGGNTARPRNMADLEATAKVIFSLRGKISDQKYDEYSALIRSYKTAINALPTKDNR